MKRIVSIVLSLALAVSVAGCSLFTDGEGGGNEQLGKVKITDAMIHEDPTDIEFADRYAMYSGETCALADMFQEQHDVKLNQEYMILYGDKDDTALRQYVYYVFDSAEDALKYQQKASGEYSLDATVMEADPTVVCEVTNQEKLADSIESFIAWNTLSESTASAYAKMYAEMDVLIDYIPE